MQTEQKNRVTLALPPLFFALSLSPCKRGYSYLKSAVLLYLSGSEQMSEINKAQAKEHGVSEKSVEKDMRSMLAFSRDSEWKKRFFLITGYRFMENETLSVKKFVSIVSEHLSDERNCEKVFALKTDYCP